MFDSSTASLPVLLVLCGGTALCTAALIPWAMRLSVATGAVDRGGFRKIYHGAMPLLGGLAIGVPFVVSAVLFSVFGQWTIEHFQYVRRTRPEWFDWAMQLAQWRREWLLLALGAAAIMALGLYDDIRGMRARNKFIGQLLIATIICLNIRPLSLLRLPLLGEIHLNFAAGMLLSVLWIAGLINALNIIDGVDGLAAGITLIAASGILLLALLAGNSFGVIACSLLAGSLIAFLYFNFHPARIFLGDTGSMLLGYLLGTITLIQSWKAETATIVIAPLLALGLPILEVALSIVRRAMHGQPIFSGDDRHTHHRLLSKGYSQRFVVLLLYTVALLMTSAAVASQLIAADSAWSWLPLAIYAVTALWIAWLAGYLRPESLNKTMQRRARNAIFRKFVSYAAHSINSGQSQRSFEQVFAMARFEMRLRFLAAWLEDGEKIICVSGEPQKSAPDRALLDPFERFRIKSANGLVVVVCYQFAAHPADDEFRSVAACLAQLLEKCYIDAGNLPERSAGAKVIDLDLKKLTG